MQETSPLILPTSGEFSCILSDPPWAFQTRSAKGLEGRPQHYDRMTVKEIKALPVADAAAKDCWLFLWVTSPHLKIGLDVMDAWGFKYSSIAFTWIKLRPKACSLFFTDKDLHMGQGYTTRKNSELCLLGRRGSPKRLRKDIQEVIIDPRREHSRKPEEAYRRIEGFCGGPRLEMFARNQRPGWEVFGNQTDKFKES